MVQKTRQAVAWLAVAGMVAMGSAASVGAQTTVGDGLIQVAIGDITITDAVDIGVAAQVAAQICGVNVGPVAVLGQAVDARRGGGRVVCRSDQGPVRLVQN